MIKNHGKPYKANIKYHLPFFEIFNKILKNTENEKKNMTSKLNLNERKVLAFLENQHEATTKETAKSLDLSEATVRRIFERLAAFSLVERMHGGALLQTPNVQIRNFNEKDKRNHTEKIAIAKKAAQFIKRRDLVFLNSGSTTFQVPKYISSEKVKIMTNNIRIAMQDIKGNIALTLLGGNYNPTTCSATGSMALNSLSTTFSSLTILGTNGLHPIHGITSNSLEEVSISQKMIGNTVGKVILLADHEKVNRIASHQVCSIQQIDILITDKKTPIEYIQQYKEQGLEVLVV